MPRGLHFRSRSNQQQTQPQQTAVPQTVMEETDRIRPMGQHSAAPSMYSENIKTPGRQSPDNPFATPTDGRSVMLASHNASSVALSRVFPIQEKYFHSRRLKKEQIQRPWKDAKPDPRKKWLSIIPGLGFLLGLLICAYMVYDGYKSVPRLEFCPVYEDDFSSGKLNTDIWMYEQEVGGYGNGQFDQTTDSEENVFIKDGMLHIMPTLQDENLINSNNVLNLTEKGTCTGTEYWQCVVSTNTTNGTIINPAKSGRLSSRKGLAKLKYGRIEVVARMPTGDWLWPAIWMLPVENKYGDWPRSGEIDIAESRGNNWTYPLGGNNIMSSALHWGPDPANDAWWRTYGKQRALQSTFNKEFHTFGLEWTPKFMYTYLDTRLNQVFYNKFGGKSLWSRGNFPLTNYNGTTLFDPWSQTGDAATPFNEDFYLILNVAVGGTNGWFRDGASGKPWVDASPTARRDFWNARNEWYPTWSKDNGAAMVVKSVKMQQLKGFNGC